MPEAITVVQQTLGAGGVSIKKTKSETYSNELSVAGTMNRAFTGQLTTRSSNTAGVITFTENHAFQVNDRVTFLNGTTIGPNLLVTAITSNTITFTSLAVGSLPALNTNGLLVGKNQSQTVLSFNATGTPTPKVLTKADKGNYIVLAGPSATVSTTGNNSIMIPNSGRSKDLIADMAYDYAEGYTISGTVTTIDTLVFVNFEQTTNPYNAVCLF